MPVDLIKMFTLTYTLGPATAVPYLIQYWPRELIFIVLFVCYTAPLPLLFMGLSKLSYATKTKNKVISLFANIGEREFKKAKKGPDDIMEYFEKKWAYLGHSVATTFMAFAMGFLWASIFAYSFKLPRNEAYKSIAIGNVLGLWFWIFLIDGFKDTIDPRFFIFFFIILAGIFWIYGEIEERRIAKYVFKTKV